MKPENIADLLRQAIREKALSPGSALIQADLAAKFGVSRNPIREALRMLVADGLVEMTHGDGAVVRQLGLSDLTELYELRLQLEPQLATQIVELARKTDIERLRVLALAMKSESMTARWMQQNFEFHSSLFHLTEKPRTTEILINLLNAVQPYSLENVDQLGGRTQASEEHLEMVDAIEKSDAVRLANLTKTHLQAALNRLEDRFASVSVDIENRDLIASLGFKK
jgi:DNA-binding GntR family transcriptional regulator